MPKRVLPRHDVPVQHRVRRRVRKRLQQRRSVRGQRCMPRRSLPVRGRSFLRGRVLPGGLFVQWGELLPAGQRDLSRQVRHCHPRVRQDGGVRRLPEPGSMLPR